MGALLHQLEERLCQPEVRKSAVEVGALLSEQFVEFGSSGRIYDKKQSIEGLRNEPMIPIALTEFKTLVLAPDVVLVTYRGC